MVIIIAVVEVILRMALVATLNLALLLLKSIAIRPFAPAQKIL